MDERELTNLLRTDENPGERGSRCPDSNQLAAYVNKQLSPEKKERLEKHFADCRACLEALAFLTTEMEEPGLVPPQLLVRARALARRPEPSPVWRWGWALAATTACLLFFVAFIFWTSRSTQTPNNLVAQVNDTSTASQSPTPAIEVSSRETATPSPKSRLSKSNIPLVRGANDTLKPVLVLPKDGATLRVGDQTLQWKAIPDTDFYELKIVTEDGRPVLAERTNQTHYLVAGSLLQSGTKYFVRVDAHLNGGRSVRSELVTFKVSSAVK